MHTQGVMNQAHGGTVSLAGRLMLLVCFGMWSLVPGQLPADGVRSGPVELMCSEAAAFAGEGPSGNYVFFPGGLVASMMRVPGSPVSASLPLMIRWSK